ncbi:bifunctional DNA primase/polymerase [Streptomyces sp. RB6PN25]|uniref:Bifunctional DNA primase/polymerase n=1 Tax=Streptomyces humicola TaxID=2953240 RepID=A0ABT1PZV8_9ACTN|nr:bifunctional DNA primase/polymerase [Streptomyces humicola]MCQ4083169.1 bifunctional DNA primase/polymerase [Streptomyces humicola]
MREILGRRRRLKWSSQWSKAKRERSALRAAALSYAAQWKWPVLPGAGSDRAATDRDEQHRGGDRACACPRPDCAVPGGHPYDPGLLAATTDPTMIGWWWTNRPDAPVILATGGAVSAVSLPAVAGARALATLEETGVRLGPVVATPTRCVLLVAPYSFEELGELLDRHDWVPSSLRYHGRGGYVVLPPSRIAAGQVSWARPPRPGPDGGAPRLPRISVIVDTLVEAGVGSPDGSRLAY